MYDIDQATAWSSAELWAWFSAGRAITEAVTALESAGAGLAPLIAESDWHAKGVRALHELLVELSDGVAAQLGQLRARQWELEMAGR